MRADRKQLNQDLKRHLAIYNQTKQHHHLKEAQTILAALGRSTQQLKKEAEAQQIKLF